MEIKLDHRCIRIEVIRDIDQFEGLQAEWERLAIESIDASVYAHPTLLSLWWRNFGGDSSRPFILQRGINLAGEASSVKSLYIVVAYVDEHVVAILPMMILRVKVQGRDGALQCLHFLGDPIFNPYPSLVAIDKADQVVFEKIAEHIKCSSEWDAIFFSSVRQDFPLLTSFLKVLAGVLPFSMEHKLLREVQYFRFWDRDMVIRDLKKLINLKDKYFEPQLPKIVSFIEGISKMSSAEFASTCLTKVNSELLNLLEPYRVREGEFQEVIKDIDYKTSQTLPYIVQLFYLPESEGDLVALFSSGKRHQIKKQFQECAAKGISFSCVPELETEQFNQFEALHRSRHAQSVHFNLFTKDYYGNLLKSLRNKNALFWIVAKNNAGRNLLFSMYFYDKYSQSIEFISSGAERSEINLGDLATVLAMKKGCEMKAKLFSFRMGAERYKERFHTKSVPLNCFFLTRVSNVNCRDILPRQWRS